MAALASIVFLIATGIGVWMRLGLAGVPQGIPFEHLLHAHSHALYFGWAGLVTLLAAGARRIWMVMGVAMVAPMTVAFLAQGYGPWAIATSAAVMAFWYCAIGSCWQSTNRAFRWSLGYVIASTAGVLILAFLQATDSGTEVERALAIHSFLSTFAWSLVLATVGILGRTGRIDSRVARQISSLLGSSAWLVFPLGVAGGPEYPVLGPLSRTAVIVLLAGVALLGRVVWSTGLPALRIGVVWLGIAAAGLAAVAVGGSSVLAATGRAGVVIYLHALLLGYVTTMLVWYLTRGSDLGRALHSHHLGIAVMLGALTMPRLGLAGAWVAVAGAIVVWLAAWQWAPRTWRVT